MKVLDLCCSAGHRFEGWFGSEDDYRAQQEQGLIGCPVCGDQAVTRLPSAPRINRGTTEVPPQGPRAIEASGPAPASASVAEQLQAAWLRAAQRLVETTEDVGERFVDEARQIHAGQQPERAIRGRATPEDAQSLRDEGIDVFAFPLPDALKGPRH